MAHWLMHFLNKHEDPSSELQNSHKTPAVAVGVCHPTSGWVGDGDRWLLGATGQPI